MYTYICENCGAYLDPGERCDCRKEAEESALRLKKFLTADKNGQISFDFKALSTK